MNEYNNILDPNVSIKMCLFSHCGYLGIQLETKPAELMRCYLGAMERSCKHNTGNYHILSCYGNQLPCLIIQQTQKSIS